MKTTDKEFVKMIAKIINDNWELLTELGKRWIKMSDCQMCKNYYEEPKNNYYDCKINADDKYWEGKEDCPHYEEREDI